MKEHHNSNKKNEWQNGGMKSRKKQVMEKKTKKRPKKDKQITKDETFDMKEKTNLI